MNYDNRNANQPKDNTNLNPPRNPALPYIIIGNSWVISANPTRETFLKVQLEIIRSKPEDWTETNIKYWNENFIDKARDNFDNLEMYIRKFFNAHYPFDPLEEIQFGPWENWYQNKDFYHAFRFVGEALKSHKWEDWYRIKLAQRTRVTKDRMPMWWILTTCYYVNGCAPIQAASCLRDDWRQMPDGSWESMCFWPETRNTYV
jgi:hypothetical protein